MRPRIVLPLVLALAPLGQAASLPAQVVVGTVHDSATSLPIRGAFLELLDSSWARMGATLSDSAGRFRIPVQAGRYTFRVEAIGYADEAVPLELAGAAQRALDLRLAPQPVLLPELGVEGAPRCRLRSDTSGAVLAVWSQARKLLRLADWSMKESALTLVKRTYARTYSARSSRVSYDDTVRVDTVSREPAYITLASDSLRKAGVFQPTQDTARFFAPGPDYILSDDFLEAHCFSVHRSRKRLGLDFVPVGRYREGEIRGTLWLDPDLRALQQVEFRYNDVARPIRILGADGSIDFARTPAGHIYIRRWVIRLPMYFGASGMVRVKERGGEVVKYWVAEK